MRMHIAFLLTLLMSFSLGCSEQAENTPSQATESSDTTQDGPVAFKAGHHYQVLPNPVPTSTGDKIEVVEAFAYTCGHCFTFESIIQPWKKTLSDDVEFVPMSVAWRENMQVYSRIFYSAVNLGVINQVHPKVFEKLHVEGKPFADGNDIFALFEPEGISAELFNQTFASEQVNQQIKQAYDLATQYQLQGTPSLVVNGKYLITASAHVGQAMMVEVADFLIEKERQVK